MDFTLCTKSSLTIVLPYMSPSCKSQAWSLVREALSAFDPDEVALLDPTPT
jgi:hypothetical protein